LEAVIHEQSGYYRVTSLNSPAVLKAKAIEADKHLQDMINEVSPCSLEIDSSNKQCLSICGPRIGRIVYFSKY
uniref:ProRS-C_1 domain-containing protein n=1 Tax=Brugia timori TaxID=42155 RepID=A0A0R3Q7Q6_9BILA